MRADYVFYAAICDAQQISHLTKVGVNEGGEAAGCLMEIRGNNCGRETPSFSLSPTALPVFISSYNSRADSKIASSGRKSK